MSIKWCNCDYCKKTTPKDIYIKNAPLKRKITWKLISYKGTVGFIIHFIRGLYFGYPSCCSKQWALEWNFEKYQLKYGRVNRKLKIGYKQYPKIKALQEKGIKLGYIPCNKCIDRLVNT